MASIAPSKLNTSDRFIPTTLRVATVAVLLFILVLMTGDVVIWAHGGMHWSFLAIALVSEMLVVGVWLTFEMRSTRYQQPSIERPTQWFAHHLRRLPLLFVGFLIVTYGLRLAAFWLHGRPYGLELNSFLFALLAVELCKVSLLYFCWLGLVFGFQSLREVRERNERLLSTQRSLAEAQLTQLRAQLRPHFLFNALNTVSATMQSDVSRADRLLTDLGDLLRANLDSTRDLVTLAEELQLMRRYADIMQARFGDRVTLDWQIDERATSALIPSMLLQPLLENAYKHGVERDASAQTIRVSARQVDDSLVISIQNTGSLSQPYREGFGTRSCRERLALMYGGEASCILREQPPGQVEARIQLPLRLRSA